MHRKGRFNVSDVSAPNSATDSVENVSGAAPKQPAAPQVLVCVAASKLGDWAGSLTLGDFSHHIYACCVDVNFCSRSHPSALVFCCTFGGMVQIWWQACPQVSVWRFIKKKSASAAASPKLQSGYHRTCCRSPKCV